MAQSFANENIPPRRSKDIEKYQDKVVRRPLANLPLNRYIAHAAPLFHQDHQLKPLKRVSRISLLTVTAQQPLYSQSFSPASFHPQDPVQSPCCTKKPGHSTAHVHCTTPRNAPLVPFSPLRPTHDAYEGSSSTQELSPLMQQGHSMDPVDNSITFKCADYELHTLKRGKLDCSSPLQTAPPNSPETASNAAQTICMASPSESSLTDSDYYPYQVSPHSQTVQNLLTPQHRTFSNPFFVSARPPLHGKSAPPSHSNDVVQSGMSVSVATQTETSLEEYMLTKSMVSPFSQHTPTALGAPLRAEPVPQVLHTPVRVLKKPLRSYSPLRPRSGSGSCSSGRGRSRSRAHGCTPPPENPLLQQQRRQQRARSSKSRTPKTSIIMSRAPVETFTSSPDAMSSVRSRNSLQACSQTYRQHPHCISNSLHPMQDCGSDYTELHTPHLAGRPSATVSRKDRELHDSTSSLPCFLPEACSESPLSKAPLKQLKQSTGGGRNNNARCGSGVAIIFGTRGKLRITR